MTLNTIGTRGLISLAFIIPAALALSFCEAKAQDVPMSVKTAAVYGVDITLCQLNVPRAAINATLVAASLETGMNVGSVAQKAADIGEALTGNLSANGRIQEYCAIRAREY